MSGELSENFVPRYQTFRRFHGKNLSSILVSGLDSRMSMEQAMLSRTFLFTPGDKSSSLSAKGLVIQGLRRNLLYCTGPFFGIFIMYPLSVLKFFSIPGRGIRSMHRVLNAWLTRLSFKIGR